MDIVGEVGLKLTTVFDDESARKSREKQKEHTKKTSEDSTESSRKSNEKNTQNTKKAYQKMGEYVTNFGRRVDGVFRGIAGSYKYQLAGLGAVGLFNKALNEASAASESLGTIQAIFEKNAEVVIANSNLAAERLGLSAVQYRERAAQMSAHAARLVVGTGQDMSAQIDELITRAADIGAAFNMSTADATTLLSGALTGETEPIRRYGIDVSVAALEQYYMVRGLKKAKTPLTEQQKLMARYAILMEKTGALQGRFAAEADGYAGSMKILKADFLDVLAKVGTQFLPYAIAAVQYVNELVDKFAALDPGTQKLVVIVSGIAIALPFLIVGFGMVASSLMSISKFSSSTVGAVSRIGGALLGVGKSADGTKRTSSAITKGFKGLVSAIKNAKSPFGWLLRAFKLLFVVARPILIAISFMFSPIGLAIAAVVAAITFAVYAFKNWDKVKEYTAKAWEAVKGFASKAWVAIKEFTAKAVDAFKDWLSSMGEKLKEIGPKILPAIGRALAFIIPAVFRLWFEVQKTFIKLVYEVLKQVGITILLLPAYMAKAVWLLIKWRHKIMRALVEGMVELTKKIITILKNWVTELGSLITRGIRAIPSIFSKAWDAIKSAFRTSITYIQKLIPRMIDAVRNMASNVRDKFNELRRSAPDAIRAMVARIKDLISGLGGWFRKAGRFIIDGLISGVRNGKAAILREIADIANTIKERFARIWQIKSPSRVAMGLMGNIFDGFDSALAKRGPFTVQAFGEFSDATLAAAKTPLNKTATVPASDRVAATHRAFNNNTYRAGDVNNSRQYTINVDATGVNSPQSVVNELQWAMKYQVV